MKIWYAVAALALCASTAFAQSAPPASQSSEDEIVVTAQRQLLRDFVGELSAEPNSEDQIARWDRRICPSVAGLPARQAQYIVDRIAYRAYGVDLEAGEPGCRVNVLVIVTRDSDVIAQTIFEDYGNVVASIGDEDGNTRGRAALNDFVHTPRAVRWWHVSQTVTENGQVLGGNNGRSSRTGDGFSGVQVARVTDPGRLRRSTRQDFNRVLIIVDAARAQGIQFEALADYISMVALAQLDPTADTREYPTILNLFSDREAGRQTPVSMTEWDEAYLTGLYGAPRQARNSRQQENAIARSMQGENLPASPH